SAKSLLQDPRPIFRVPAACSFKLKIESPGQIDRLSWPISENFSCFTEANDTKHMMDQLIARVTGQLEEAMEIGRNANIRKPVNPIEHIYVAGLGGSGIGADFVSAFIKN